LKEVGIKQLKLFYFWSKVQHLGTERIDTLFFISIGLIIVWRLTGVRNKLKIKNIFKRYRGFEPDELCENGKKLKVFGADLTSLIISEY